MARVQVYQVVEHLQYQMKKALAAAVENAVPNAEFDANDLYRAFKRAVSHKCNQWERVPDSYVDTD